MDAEIGFAPCVPDRVRQSACRCINDRVMKRSRRGGGRGVDAIVKVLAGVEEQLNTCEIFQSWNVRGGKATVKIYDNGVFHLGDLFDKKTTRLNDRTPQGV